MARAVAGGGPGLARILAGRPHVHCGLPVVDGEARLARAGPDRDRTRPVAALAVRPVPARRPAAHGARTVRDVRRRRPAARSGRARGRVEGARPGQKLAPPALPRPAVDPAVYVSAEVGPDGYQTWQVLVNVAPQGRVDWRAPGLAEAYADRVLALLASRGLDI